MEKFITSCNIWETLATIVGDSMQGCKRRVEGVDPVVIKNSVGCVGFGYCDEWMIFKHNIYNNSFKLFWSNHEILETNEVYLCGS